MIDLSGKRFGKLVVLRTTDKRKNGYIIWKCRCDCGNEIEIDYRKLMRGTANDCGCNTIKGRTDLRGQRFGKLTVVSQTDRNSSAGWYWLCKCDCGGTVEAPSRQLLSGYRKSCGCLSKPPLKQYVGKQFGDLTVLSYAGKRNGSHLWHCRCVCGKEVNVQQTNLQSGHSTSCGCKNDIKKNIHFVNGTNVDLIRSSKIFTTNTSGVRGVYWSKRQNKWVAQITFQGKTKHLGSFKTIEEAASVRKHAEERVFGEFLEWYDSEQEQM